MALVFYALLWANGGNDIIAHFLNLSINDLTWFTRIALFVVPPLAFLVTKRICLGLQRRDREKVLHGRETGEVYRLQTGEVLERHEPLSPEERWLLVQHDGYLPIEPGPRTDANGVRRKGAALEGLRHRISKFYFGDAVPPVTPYELAQAQAHHHAVEGHDTGDRPDALEGHETDNSHRAVGRGDGAPGDGRLVTSSGDAREGGSTRA
jgi:ubiquinol-cytochrome c reductase cytochrome b subunit